MSKQTVIELETNETRMQPRSRTAKQFEKTELQDVAGHSMLVLAGSIANAIVLGIELREKRKVRRLSFMIAGGMVVAFGLIQLAAQFLKN